MFSMFSRLISSPKAAPLAKIGGFSVGTGFHGVEVNRELDFRLSLTDLILIHDLTKKLSYSFHEHI